MNRHFLKTVTATATACGIVLAAHADSYFFRDTFERPDQINIGPGWQVGTGNWSISNNAVVMTGTDYNQAVYIGLDTSGHPYVVESDISGDGNNRWPGIAFNIDPANHGNFYALIVRVEGNNPSAAQFRRYTNWSHGSPQGSRAVLVSEVIPGQINANELYRYRVVSTEPGIFDLTIFRLDQDSREPLEIVWEKQVEDHNHTWGGRAGLYGNSNIRWDDFLVAYHTEPAEPANLSIHEAMEVEFFADEFRFYQAQVLENGEWVNHGSRILGKGEIASIRVPRDEPGQVRIVTGSE